MPPLPRLSTRHLSAALCALLATSATPAAAQVVGSRAALSTILGSGGVTEGFERFSVTPGSAVFWNGTSLDASTNVPGQGTNMVAPNLRLESTAGSFQVAGQGYFGLPSQTFTAYGSDNFADILFTKRVEAFGLDLLDYAGYGDVATVSVFGTGNTLLHTATVNVNGPTPAFFGYESASAIERVRIDGSTQSWAPLLDNLSFGIRSSGARIDTRAALAALLGTGGAIEDFERFSVTPGSAVFWNGTSLDASTNVPGQGTNMVRPDLRFESTAGSFQVAGQGYFGLPSQTFTAYGSDNYGDVLFASAVNAVGFDLLDYAGYTDVATVSVFGDGDVLLHQETMNVNGPTPAFFGYQDARDIRRIRVEGSRASWMPLMDDIAYGQRLPTTSVPEPATLALLGGGLAVLGLARLRRRA